MYFSWATTALRITPTLVDTLRAEFVSERALALKLKMTVRFCGGMSLTKGWLIDALARWFEEGFGK